VCSPIVSALKNILLRWIIPPADVLFRLSLAMVLEPSWYNRPLKPEKVFSAPIYTRMVLRLKNLQCITLELPVEYGWISSQTGQSRNSVVCSLQKKCKKMVLHSHIWFDKQYS